MTDHINTFCQDEVVMEFCKGSYKMELHLLTLQSKVYNMLLNVKMRN